jgi:VIT family
MAGARSRSPGWAALCAPYTEASGRAAAGLPRRDTGRSTRQTNWLRDVILGGQDGLVNILGIILGVSAGGGSKTVLPAAGFAAAITESVSMGAVGWTSALSERDYYAAGRAREPAEIDNTPGAERQEIRDIYAGQGFSGTCSTRSWTRSPPTATPGCRR